MSGSGNRFYAFASAEIGKAGGHIYLEIDWKADLVVRQVSVYDGRFHRGEWTGDRLIGEIADKAPSGFGMKPDEEIAEDEFEIAWGLSLLQD